MNHDLEALLKAWDTYRTSRGGIRSEVLFDSYDRLLKDIAGRLSRDPATIHQTVRYAYPAWARANARKFPSV